MVNTKQEDVGRDTYTVINDLVLWSVFENDRWPVAIEKD